MTAYGNEEATDTFTFDCKVCGATVHVEEGQRQPHRCRIDLDAQRGHHG